jgi:hypothetical protein
MMTAGDQTRVLQPAFACCMGSSLSGYPSGGTSSRGMRSRVRCRSLSLMGGRVFRLNQMSMCDFSVVRRMRNIQRGGGNGGKQAARNQGELNNTGERQSHQESVLRFSNLVFGELSVLIDPGLS